MSHCKHGEFAVGVCMGSLSCELLLTCMVSLSWCV